MIFSRGVDFGRHPEYRYRGSPGTCRLNKETSRCVGEGLVIRSRVERLKETKLENRTVAQNGWHRRRR